MASAGRSSLGSSSSLGTGGSGAALTAPSATQLGSVLPSKALANAAAAAAEWVVQQQAQARAANRRDADGRMSRTGVEQEYGDRSH